MDDALQTNERAIVNMVDDDTFMRGALESVFDSVGLATLRPARGFLAMQLADKPGCVVIDIRLPDMNAAEVLKLKQS
jgi:FixJ family two-component response regulator